MKIKAIHEHFTEEQLDKRVREMSAEISKDYGDETV